MKKFRACVAFGVMSLLFGSCSKDFDVAAPYKYITSANGFMNMSDTAHYIRIQKAYLDPNKDATQLAKISDSSYYTNLQVNMREISSTGSVVASYDLPRVDLAQEGYPKDPGAFFTSPNYAYKFKKKLNPNYQYRLVITNNELGIHDSATTVVFDENKFVSQQFLQFTLDFTSRSQLSKLVLQYSSPSESARLFQGIIRFHWFDKDVQTGVLTADSGDFKYYDGVPQNGGGTITLETNTQLIYPGLYGVMGEAPAGVERLIDSVDIFTYTSTQDYIDYSNYLLVAGGLTGDQIRPQYSNFTGANIIGLFTARAVVVEHNVPIEPRTIEVLKTTDYANVNKLKIVGPAPR